MLYEVITSREYGVTREECDAIVLRRQEQYRDSLANDREFQKRYLFPVEVQVSRKKTIRVEEDEGVPVSTKEGLAGLRPVAPGGVHTYGSQTYPADGNCGLCVTSREKARELSRDPKVEVRIVSFGYARTKKGYMAAAVAPSAQKALSDSGIKEGLCLVNAMHITASVYINDDEPGLIMDYDDFLA